jgi:hypothetical protein
MDQKIMQEVLIEDSYGELWLAYYALNKTDLNEWKIFAIEVKGLNARRI